MTTPEDRLTQAMQEVLDSGKNGLIDALAAGLDEINFWQTPQGDRFNAFPDSIGQTVITTFGPDGRPIEDHCANWRWPSKHPPIKPADQPPSTPDFGR